MSAWTRAQIIRSVVAGTQWDVTNHYIDREDHPCFGTRRRTIVRTSASNVTFPCEDGTDSVPWGKGLERDDDGTVRIYNDRVADGPFLTLRPAFGLTETGTLRAAP